MLRIVEERSQTQGYTVAIHECVALGSAELTCGYSDSQQIMRLQTMNH